MYEHCPKCGYYQKVFFVATIGDGKSLSLIYKTECFLCKSTHNALIVPTPIWKEVVLEKIKG